MNTIKALSLLYVLTILYAEKMVLPTKSNGQYVLVTGGTGYLGAHVVSVLLDRGYKVRAAVRNQKKADALAAK